MKNSVKIYTFIYILVIVIIGVSIFYFNNLLFEVYDDKMESEVKYTETLLDLNNYILDTSERTEETTSEDCILIADMTVVDLLENVEHGDEENEYILLSEYQSSIILVELTNELYQTLEKDNNYTFTFESNNENYYVINIEETSRTGLEMESIYLCE